ncbi:hypothetical protein ACFVWX_23250 [Streptomyces sp. NPDC058220]|uniref:hypothetical protein n=2 Tax=Streptomyces TaxID=1883 RepID=UPI00365A9F16
MTLTRTRRPRPLAITAALTGLLAAGAGLAGINGAFTHSGASPAADTVSVAAAEAKNGVPDCMTSWQRYQPRKTFLWQKTSGWFYVNDAVRVRFRSNGGEYYWRLNSQCKRVEAWKAGVSEYQTLGKGPEAYVPRAGSWSPNTEYCGKNSKVNVIVACYRGESRTWKP